MPPGLDLTYQVMANKVDPLTEPYSTDLTHPDETEVNKGLSVSCS